MKAEHLTREELAMAALGDAELSPEAVGHLAQCGQCQTQARELNARLEGLAPLAREMTPYSPARFRPPARAKVRRPGWSWPRTALAGCAVAALALWVVWAAPWQPGLAPAPHWQEEHLALILDQEPAVETTFANFVTGLEHQAADEDFVDFIAPAADEGPETQGEGLWAEQLSV